MNKILIIEDEDILAEMYESRLKKEKFKVKRAKNSEIGFKIIKEDRPDLILLDLLLPKIDGMETLKILKNKEKTKDIPIFILTNYDTPEERKQASSLGAEKYILKTSITLDGLTEIVKKKFEK